MTKNHKKYEILRKDKIVQRSQKLSIDKVKNRVLQTVSRLHLMILQKCCKNLLTTTNFRPIIRKNVFTMILLIAILLLTLLTTFIKAREVSITLYLEQNINENADVKITGNALGITKVVLGKVDLKKGIKKEIAGDNFSGTIEIAGSDSPMNDVKIDLLINGTQRITVNTNIKLEKTTLLAGSKSKEVDADGKTITQKELNIILETDIEENENTN